VKRPQWDKYIDASWSEANNCSKFRSQSMLDKVQAALASKSRTRGATPLICPTEARAMKALVKKYSPKNRPWLQRHLLNTRLGVVGN
jgi:nicotinamide riboside kinase